MIRKQIQTCWIICIAVLILGGVAFGGCNITDENPYAQSNGSDSDGDVGDDDIDPGEDAGGDVGDVGEDIGPECSEGESCGGECVDLQSDESNCGECGQACGGELTCMSGGCGCEDEALTACDSQCVSTTDDPDHCGECGITCSSGYCDDGECSVGPCDVDAAPFGGGSGASDEPYRICSPEHLMQMGEEAYQSANFALYRNIDFAEYGGEFSPIGGNEFSFDGTFNGNDREIRNLTIGEPAAKHVGLFGMLSGQVHNLHLVDISLMGNASVGGVAGESTGHIWEVSVQGTLGAYNHLAGGIVGHNEENGDITDSSAEVQITAYEEGDSIGGLAGRNRGSIKGSLGHGEIVSAGAASNIGGLVGLQEEAGAIDSCSAHGNITIDGEGENIGGLVGSSNDSSVIHASSADGNVLATASSKVGGLVGFVDMQMGEDQTGIYITESRADGDVSGDSDVGGLVGELGNNPGVTAEIEGGIATGEVSGRTLVGGLVGRIYGGTVRRSGAHGDVYSELSSSSAGGFFGSAGYYSITESYATGDVYGGAQSGGFGGSVGYGTVTDCYATGEVQDGEESGGFLGIASYGGPRTSYSTGSVQANSKEGGFLAVLNSTGSVIDSYWNTTSSGTTESADGYGRNEAEFQEESTFENWDFDSIWEMSSVEGRPVLQWE